jgi:hypothetical protein
MYQRKAVVGDQGTVTVTALPLSPGDVVDVHVIKLDSPSSMEDVRQRLRGSVVRYDDPFEPAVPPEEWDALR